MAATVLGECGTGNNSTPQLAIETPIDLEGNPCPGRLSINGRYVVVSNGAPDASRQWPLEEIDSLRAQPAIGSHFVQARAAGQWVDLIRRPGDVDALLAERLAALNSAVAFGSGADQSSRARPPHGEFGGNDQYPRQDGATETRGMAAQLASLLRPFRRSVLLLLVLSAVAVAIELIPPLLQGFLVDRVLKPASGPPVAPNLLYLLLAIVSGLLLVRLAATATGVWKGYVSSRVGTGMTADLRNTLVEKLNALPLAFHDRNQVGVLMSQVAYDTETLHTLIYHVTSGLLLQVLQLIGISIAMFYLSPELAVFTLLPMPVILAGSWYFTRYLQPRQHHYWEAVGKQASSLVGMLSGMRVVKAFVQERREIRRFEQASRRLRDSRRAVDVSTSTFTAAMGMLFAVGVLAVWYFGGREVLFGRMTIGSLMAFLGYLAMFYAPLTSMAESTAWFANFFGTSRRICDVLNVPSEPEARQAKVSLGRVRGKVELSDVTFGYDKSRPVLKEVSFAISPGQMVGVVGRSGSGKSTLVSLIGRLYEADSGEIRIDDIDVRQVKRQDLRRQIGMVPQDPFLFRGKIADNIAYGNVHATPVQILLAAKQADAHDFIMATPLAYSTQLREGGAGLSGGERQRLSIARALLFDPAILILDEATSSVDSEAERAIWNTVRRWTRQRTAIVVSHRLSSLRGADHVLVFDEGCLVEQGTHQELIAQGGIYCTLARLQGNVTELESPIEEAVAAGGGSGVHSAVGDAVEEPRFSPLSGCHDSEDDDCEMADNGIGWIDPNDCAIAAAEQGALRVTSPDGTFDGVHAVRAFPTDCADQCLSLRRREPSGRWHEVGMIDSLDRWPPAAQDAVRRSLGRHYLLRRIVAIRQIRTSENVLALSVATEAGPAAIRLEKPGEGSQPFGQNGLLLTDSKGNHFVIADRGAIPRWQQRLLTLYFGD